MPATRCATNRNSLRILRGAGACTTIPVAYFGLFAPAGTSAQIADRIHRDATAIIKRPEFVEKYITASSFELVANSPVEFADLIRADVASIGAMVKAANIQAE